MRTNRVSILKSTSAPQQFCPYPADAALAEAERIQPSESLDVRISAHDTPGTRGVSRNRGTPFYWGGVFISQDRSSGVSLLGFPHLQKFVIFPQHPLLHPTTCYHTPMMINTSLPLELAS